MAIYGRDFAEVYNVGWAKSAPRFWPFLTKRVARHNPQARTWLDLCCGTGSLLKLVAKSGFDAVGLDASPHQLRHAGRNVPRARLVRGDVRSFALAQKFDVVTCFGDSLNYLTLKSDLARAFRAVRRHLADRGIFVFDMNTLLAIQTNWRQNTSASFSPRRTVIMSPASFDEKRALATLRITCFVREGRLYRKFEELHTQRGYTQEEIDALLTAAGFRFSCYDGKAFSRPRKGSKRLVYVCQAASG